MTPALVASLDALAAQARQTNEKIHALVDCGATEALHPIVEAQAGTRAAGLLESTRDDSIAHLGPWLVEHEVLTAGYARLNRIRPVANTITWLQSSLDTTTLAAHLRHALEAHVEGGRHALVRFFDPQVLPGYLALLPEATRARLLAPISAWWFEAEGTLTAAHEGAANGQAEPFSVDLSEAEYFALRQIGLPQLLHPTLAQEIPEQFSTPLTQTQRSRIWQQVLIATQLGLRKFDDLTYWCLIAFGVSETIHEQAPMRQAVEAALDRDVPLAEAAGCITEAQWGAMSAGNSSKREPT